MQIYHNLIAENALNKMKSNAGLKASHMEKLSSGLRINRAGDDAAGSSISQEMKAQIRGIEQASRNVQDGVSLVDVADAGLNNIHSTLQRMRELLVQGGNDTLSPTDRMLIQDEIEELKGQITETVENTEFNGIKLLNGANPQTGQIDTV